MSNQFKRKLQVFVSSTFTDLKIERQIAVQAILENGHIPAGMELFAAGNEEQMKVIRRWIDQSDIFLLILGKRYGSIESKSSKSYIQLEYEYALEKGIPFFAVILKDSFINSKVRNGEKVEDLIEKDNPQKFTVFYKMVTSKMCSFAEDNKDIKLAIWQSIKDLETRHEFVGWVSGESIMNNSKILEEIGSLANKNALLQEQKNSLESKIKELEINKEEKKKYDGRTFQELNKLLYETKVKIKIKNQKELEINLLEALNHFSSILAGGVSNAASSSGTEGVLYTKVATPLAVYGLMQFDKVPSSVFWQRLIMSPLGKQFLYEFRTRNTIDSPQADVKKEIDTTKQRISSKQTRKKKKVMSSIRLIMI